jgi:hypothetical protein
MPLHLHGVFARAVGIFLLVGSGVAAMSGASNAASAPGPTSCGMESGATSTGGPAYYLIESSGAVDSCGDAPLHGSKAGAKLPAPVVGGAATDNGAGYWLATGNGRVYPFGNAGSFGSAAHLRLSSPIVAFVPTPDDQGYWMVSAKGNLLHYGDAGFFGSTVHNQKDGPVVALLATPDGKGYWIVSAKGVVHHFGDAPPVGSLTHPRPAVIAAAATPDGRGLLLLTKDGGVQTLGTASFYGSLVHHRLSRPLTSIAPSADGAGYFLTDATGSVFNYGDAAFEGSLAGSAPRRPNAVVALDLVVLPTPVVLTSAPAPAGPPTSAIPPLPQNGFGYDVSNFQCAEPGATAASASLPATSSFSVIEVAGWLDNSENSCLAAEAAWATAAAAGSGAAPYSLYLFVNAPDQSAAAASLDQNGPAGQCAALAPSAQPACLAYNYGYEGAVAAHSNAASAGVSAALWWLDVEGTNLAPSEWSNFSAGQYWSSSTTLNDDTIQGALDGLRASGATVGIYSSSVQFPTIAGPFVPSGAAVPLWVAGTPWTNPPYAEEGLDPTSVLAGWCAGTSGYSSTYPTDLFAGGVPWLLQETPGSEVSPYGIDPDYAC